MHPRLVEEWDFSKNERGPETYSVLSRERVWWKCPNNPKHKYQNNIKSRVEFFSGCKKCKRKNKISGQAQECERVFKKLGLEYTREYKLEITGQKRYDWLITSPKRFLVEFDGDQHFNFVRKYHKSMRKFHDYYQKIDIFKTWAAIHSGYRLLRISCNDIDCVEGIISEFIKSDKVVDFSSPEKYIWLSLGLLSWDITTKVPKLDTKPKKNGNNTRLPKRTRFKTNRRRKK